MLFEKMYSELIKVLEGRASEAKKYEAIEKFAQVFVNFDTSRLDKYFI